MRGCASREGRSPSPDSAQAPFDKLRTAKAAYPSPSRERVYPTISATSRLSSSTESVGERRVGVLRRGVVDRGDCAIAA